MEIINYKNEVDEYLLKRSDDTKVNDKNLAIHTKACCKN